MEGVEKVNVSTILLPITGTLQCLTWSLLYQIARRAFASVIFIEETPVLRKISYKGLQFRSHLKYLFTIFVGNLAA